MSKFLPSFRILWAKNGRSAICCCFLNSHNHYFERTIWTFTMRHSQDGFAFSQGNSENTSDLVLCFEDLKKDNAEKGKSQGWN